MSDIVVSVGANVINFIGDMSKAANAVDSVDKKTLALIRTTEKYTAAAVTAGAAVVAGLYVTAANTIDRQAKLARALNSTTASVQTLEYAADLAGISHEELAKSSGKLNAKLGQAITVGGAAAQELDRLGLSAKTLANMPADERMAAIADRIVELHYDSTQAAASLKELGLKGNEMVAMMMDGGQQIRDANKELRELNVLVSDVDAAKIEAANDAWTKVRQVITGVGNTLAVQLSPYIQVVADNLRAASVESGGFKGQINSAIEFGLTGFAKLSDVLQGLRVVFKGLELVGVTFGAAVISMVEGIATASSLVVDQTVKGINLAIDASNKLLGTSQEFLSLPSESAFMQGLHEAADATRNQVTVLANELHELAMQEMPSDKVAKFLEDVKKKSTEAAQATVAARKHMVEMPEENEETKKKKDKADNVVDGLRSGTEGMRAELSKREEILNIYRQNTIAADAPYYAQQVNDIKINEQLKQAEILASAQKDDAQRAERRANDLERVAGDREAMAAVNAEYDLQENLAEQIKQTQLTQVQQDAQLARERLRVAEKNNAINAALGLGQQLMQLVQGHSRKAFEFAKTTALASAVIDGWRSATAAWSAGMSTGGPWAPAVAAAYTASSLLRTGAMIQSIRGTSFGSSSAGSSSGGASSSSVPTASGAASSSSSAGANTGSTMYVEGLNPTSLFTGAAVQTIAQGLLQYQKDGGKVVFNA